MHSFLYMNHFPWLIYVKNNFFHIYEGEYETGFPWEMSAEVGKKDKKIY